MVEVKNLLLRILLHIKAKKKGWQQPHPNTHTSRGKKNHLIRELALIEETGRFGHGPEALKGIINENRVRVLIQVNSGLI